MREEKRIIAEGHLEELKSSGLSVAAYSRRKGLSPSTVNTWKRKMYGADIPGKFIEITKQGGVILEFTGGVKARIDENTDIRILKLLREVYGV